MLGQHPAGHSTPGVPPYPTVPGITAPITKSSTLTQVVPSQKFVYQRSSRLVRLPIEVKTIILRHLLVRDKPISTRANYEVLIKGPERDGKGRFIKRMLRKQVQGYNLSPSILRTCQSLLAVGLPILYHENLIELRVGTAVASQYSWYPPLSTLELAPKGQFNTRRITAHMSIFENQNVLQCGSRNNWTYDKEMTYVAQRFTNFLVKADYNPDNLHAAQLRSLLRQSAHIFDDRKVQLVINWNSPHFPEPLPYDLALHQLRTIKAFTLLRCSSFKLLRITDPDAIAVQDVITKCPIVVDLEQFLPTVCSMLEILMNSGLFPKSTQHSVFHTLVTKLIEAVADFDVTAFLQARHESMSIWYDVVKQLAKQNDRCKRRYLKQIPAIDSYHVKKGNWGYDVDEDGSDHHDTLWYIARTFNFSPDYKYDVRRLDIVL